jgi:hypothetical protein
MAISCTGFYFFRSYQMKKFPINLKPTLNKLLLGVGISVFLTSAVGAVQANNSSLQRSDRTLLLAQNSTYCQDGESTFISAETVGFWINICGGDLPHTYVGVSKNDGQSIRIPGEYYKNEEFEGFIAINGDVRYTLTHDSLTVTQNGETLVYQKVTRWN